MSDQQLLVQARKVEQEAKKLREALEKRMGVHRMDPVTTSNDPPPPTDPGPDEC